MIVRPTIATGMAALVLLGAMALYRYDGAIRMNRSADDEWDYYFARVDDAPASILVNLGLVDYSDGAPETTLYVAWIEMQDPAENGTGTAAEAQAFNAVEDNIVAATAPLGLRPIGRLRNHGRWQLTFMGPAVRSDAFTTAVGSSLSNAERRFETDSRPDPDWSYYRNFLFPDPERWRWMRDRGVVEQLLEHGDPLTKPRRVDHWVYFPDAAARDAFVRAAAGRNFDAVKPFAEQEDGVYGVRLFRIDSVQLDEIHEVTMTLVELAEQHGGDYDGWETSVER
jgi:regulator of RNase E activity RraB